jgi:flagellar biosynthesis regulator FlaF
MSNTLALRAYATAASGRSMRDQEADVFRQVNLRLQASLGSKPIARVRALADNRRLWLAVADLLRDPDNPLPPATRAGMISIGYSVQREMDLDDPNVDFLIAINQNIITGLSGNP